MLEGFTWPDTNVKPEALVSLVDGQTRYSRGVRYARVFTGMLDSMHSFRLNSIHASVQTYIGFGSSLKPKLVCIPHFTLKSAGVCLVCQQFTVV